MGPAELWIWPGNFGLASAHPPSLRLFTYLRMLGQPVRVAAKSLPLTVPTGILPYFRYREAQSSDFEEIRNYFTLKDKSIDTHLTPQERSDAYVYEKYANTNLEECFQFAWWKDEKNYDESIRPWFAKSITIPFNFYYPDRFKKHAADFIETIYSDADDKDVYYAVYAKLDSCLQSLSVKLGQKSFFFGDKPCSVDATVFSYLAPILKVPLKNPKIANELNKYDNLVKYVNRVQQTYFKEYEEEYKKNNPNPSSTAKKGVQEKDKTDQFRNTVFAIIIASIAMLGYAHSNGLILRNLNDGNVDYADMFDSDDE